MQRNHGPELHTLGTIRAPVTVNRQARPVLYWCTVTGRVYITKPRPEFALPSDVEYTGLIAETAYDAQQRLKSWAGGMDYSPLS